MKFGHDVFPHLYKDKIALQLFRRLRHVGVAEVQYHSFLTCEPG